MAFLVLPDASAASRNPQAEPSTAASVAEKEPVAADLAPFLGTWMWEELIPVEGSDEPTQIQRYMLIRWHRGRFQVKTVDYLVDLKTRTQESTWSGLIAVDRWNQSKQTFTPMSDGTISVGLSGTNGIGPSAANFSWWAAGRLTLLEPEDETALLRFHTFKGYAPSARGNLWLPFDRTYRLLSRELDRRFSGEPRY